MYNPPKKYDEFGSINYQELYKIMKTVHSLDCKQIKKMLLYNYVNDSINSVIFDYRNKNNLLYFPNIPNNSRLILILRDYEDIKTSYDLTTIRERICSNQQISELFHIYNNDYIDALKSYPFLFNKNRINFPLCIIPDVLYIGGFINSKNQQTIQCLKIKTIVSLIIYFPIFSHL